MKNRLEIVVLAFAIMVLMPLRAFAGDLFTPFTGSDYAGLGLTAIADFADLDSSYSLILHERSVYNGFPRYNQKIPCPNGVDGCIETTHRTLPSGEMNPLITGLFGTRYPTALDYTAFGALELAVQAGIAWVLPEDWRKGAWGLFVGIGAADSVMNSYNAGVTFRF